MNARRPWLRPALCAGLIALGCTSLELNSRTESEGLDGPITSSPYPPEKRENCREVGRHDCRYWQDPLRSVTSQCTESAKDAAVTRGVNYIQVDEHKRSNDGLERSAPVAILYHCEDLIER